MKKLTLQKTIFIFIILWSFLIIYPVAAIPQCGDLIVSPNTQNSINIIWSYNVSDNLIGMSINGYIIEDFDNQSGIYEWYSPRPSTATIRIWNEIDSGCNTSRILSPVKTSSENISDVINMYLLFILGLACLIVGLWLPPLGLGAMLFGLLGLMAYNNSTVMILLYLVLIIVGIIEIVAKDSWA